MHPTNTLRRDEYESKEQQHNLFPLLSLSILLSSGPVALEENVIAQTK